MTTDRFFAFASEPQALVAAGLAFPGERLHARSELLKRKYTSGADTIYPGIQRVLPGETVVVEGGTIVSRRVRPALPEGPLVPIAHADALQKLDAVLLNSVTAHLRSDVPYGLFLSGGIDSSALLALMRRATGTRVRVLTVGWEGGGAVDESAEAERLAGVMGADCHRLAMTERDFWTLAPRIAAAIDDPTADAAVLPTWMLGRAARADGLKVTLCGEGADELFGGYSRYRRQRMPWRWIARTPPGDRTDGRTRMQRAQAADIAEWLPNDLLTKLDRCLMAHGVEGRTPFLDPLVAEFAFRLPDREKASLRYGKTLLRDWLAGTFPEAGAYARKKGFKPPVGAWIAARTGTLVELVSEHPAIRSVVGRAAVRARLERAASDPQPAWSLLFYALWHSRHVLAIDSSGDVAEVLSAARAMASP
jgi:asparagine synthase (glutamine-hydrolysing)